MGIFFVSIMNQRRDPRLRNPPFFVKSCQFYRTLRQFSKKVAFRSAGLRISCGAQKRRCRNRVFPIGGWTEVWQNVCFCYIRTNGGKKESNIMKTTTFTIEQMIKFIASIKNIPLEYKASFKKVAHTASHQFFLNEI